MPKARNHWGNQHRLCQVRVGASGEGGIGGANGTVLDIIHARKLLKEAQHQNTSEQTRALVEQIPIFVRFLQSPSDDVRQQAVRALGSIAVDSPQFRDFVLQSGGLEPILAEINESDSSSMTRDAACTLRHLCSGKPAPPFEWVSPALGTLATLLYSTDVEVLADACGALSSLASVQIAAVIDAGVCCRLVELFSHRSSRVQTQALRVVNNIAAGDADQKQVILECGSLHPLRKLLSHTKQTIRKKSCGIIRNITAGSSQQIAEVISSDIIPPFVRLFQAADNDIKREAAAAICNVSAGGSAEVTYLIQAGCIKPMVDLLDISDVAILVNALQTLENILYTGTEKQTGKGQSENPHAILIEEADGVAKMQILLGDQNEDVYQKAALILSSFFPLDLPVAAPVSASVLTMPTENVMVPRCKAKAGVKHVATGESSVFGDLAWACQPPMPELAWAASAWGAGQSSGDLFGGSVFGTTGASPGNIFGGAGLNSCETVSGESLQSSGSDTSFFDADLAAGGMFIFGSDAAAGSKGQGETSTSDSGTSPQESAQSDQSFLGSESGRLPQPIQEYIADDSMYLDDDSELLDEDLPEPPVPVPPDGGCSWEWPLTRQEKKTRVGALERNINLMDQQLLRQELAELREFRASHDAAWKTHCKQRRSIG